MTARVYIGTSGWNYKHWMNGEFYPKGLKSSEWLRFFAEHFGTVEINNSFYRLPSEAAFQNWRIQVPQGFIFSVKASRFLTHIKRLKDPAGPLELFFSRAKYLKDRLGPVLFQLPPRFKVDLDRLEIFLGALETHTETTRPRCVIEVRDSTWLVPPVFDVLRAHGVALCFADWRDSHVTAPVTANFVYVRRHYGRGEGGNYPKADLDRDIESIRGWLRQGLDVYEYFNNDLGGHAIRNAGYVKRVLDAPANAGSGKRKREADSSRRLHSLGRS
jgi:uncharacterized protein YecE (DUF72 family)